MDPNTIVYKSTTKVYCCFCVGTRTFEFTVLLSAFGMVGTFFIVCDMKPYGWPRQFDLRSTDDKHVMAIDLAANKLSKDEISRILKDNGASEINEKNF